MTSPRRGKAFRLPPRDVLDLAALGETAHFVSFFTQCRDREAAAAATAAGVDGTGGGGVAEAAPRPPLRPPPPLPGPVASAVVGEAQAQRDIAALDDDDVRSVLTAGGASRFDVVGYRGDEGQSALLEAARHGHTRLCALLLSSGADVDAADDSGATALYAAAAEGHGDVVALLLAAGAAPLAVRRGGGGRPGPELPLGAARRRQHAAVELALEGPSLAAAASADVFAAAAAGDVAFLLLFPPGGPAEATPPAPAGSRGSSPGRSPSRSPIPGTPSRRQLPRQQQQQQSNDGGGVQRNAAGDTALHVALQAEPFDDDRHGVAVALLLAAAAAAGPAAVDAADGRGVTPLMAAAAAGRRGAVLALLAAGADPRRGVAAGAVDPAAEEGDPPRTAAAFAVDAVSRAVLTEAAARAAFDAEYARRDAVPFAERPAFVAAVRGLRREWLDAQRALAAAAAAAAAEATLGPVESPAASDGGDGEEAAAAAGGGP